MEKQQVILRLEEQYIDWLDTLCHYESEILTQVANSPIKMTRNSLIKGLIKSKYNDVFDEDDEKEGD